MIEKDINSVAESDLLTLIENEVSEKKTIEYKSELNLNTDSEKKEFLADISSFANTSGGDLIFGITEDKETGKPQSVDGLKTANTDKVISTIENLLRDGIKPRITGVTVVPISLSNGNHSIIIRIPNSWNAPHRVILKAHDKFYARNSNGKYPMDVDELRSAFTLTETLDKSIMDFIDERTFKLLSNKTPIPINSGSKVCLHLIPLSAFKLGRSYDLKQLDQFWRELKPMGAGSWDHQYTIDGYMAYSFSNSYSLFFRNGIIEAVNCDLLSLKYDKMFIPSTLLEKMILDTFQNYIKLYQAVNVDTPVLIFVTLVGIADHILATSNQSVRGNPIPNTNDILQLVSTRIDKLNLDYLEMSQVFRPVFDSLWNSYGYKESNNFTAEGNWAGK